MSTAITFGGNAAKAMGLNLKGAVTVLAAFAEQGEVGTLGGTKLRKVMNSLADVSPEAGRTFANLGIKLKDVFKVSKDGTKTFKGFLNLVQLLEKSTFDLTAASRIFGERVGPVMTGVVRAGSKNLIALRKALDDVGLTAKKVSDINLEGFNGQMRLLISAFEGFQIAVGESGVLTFATELTRKFTKLFESLAQTNPKLLKLGFIMLTVVGVLGPLLILFGGLVSMIGLLAPGFAVIGAAFSAVAGFISLPIVAIIAAIVALGVGLFFLITKWKAVIGFIKKIPTPLLFLLGPIGLLIKGAQLLTDNWGLVKDIFSKVLNIIKEVSKAIGKMASSLASSAVGKLSGLLGVFGFNSRRETPKSVDVPREEPVLDRLFKSVLNKLDSTLARVEIAFKNEPPGLRVEAFTGGFDLAIERGPSSGGR